MEGNYPLDAKRIAENMDLSGYWPPSSARSPLQSKQMSERESTVSEAALRDGHKANALVALLGEEFELLSAGDLDGFEALQGRKTETLVLLTSLVPV